MQAGVPTIIFVPGMKPKPAPTVHRDALWRCLCEGLRRVDAEVADDLEARPSQFNRASWTYAFYRRYRDIDSDRPGIDALLGDRQPDPRDRAEATAWPTRLRRWLFLLGDALPFLINSLAGDDMRVTLRDVARYMDNRDGIGDEVRADLCQRLIAAREHEQPVLLIGHSLGSVIAWDTLWQLSRAQQRDAGADLFVTLGSPLGNRVIQRGLAGHDERGEMRFPNNMRRWVNVVAHGELTALDRRMRNDFHEMEQAGLVDSIEDYDVYNHYRENGRLHVHSEYGYLVNRTTASIVADWWRLHSPDLAVQPVRVDAD